MYGYGYGLGGSLLGISNPPIENGDIIIDNGTDNIIVIDNGSTTEIIIDNGSQN